MSRVVLVHGIAQQVNGPETLLAEWYPALCDGVRLAGGVPPAREEVAMAFYGDLFRKPGRRGEVPLDAEDVTDELERELLLAWRREAAAIDPAVPGPEARTRLRTPYLIQRALHVLSHVRFFAGLAEHVMISNVRQARLYLTDSAIRQAARDRVAQAVTAGTRVVVAHSLGSVVAYETLHRHAAAADLTLVTLGSPLGVRNLVFDRLDPAPVAAGTADAGGEAGRWPLGRWPKPVATWVNVADRGDVVALAKRLAPLFGDRVTDLMVHNGAKAHDVRPYLTARETGAAIAAGLHRDAAQRAGAP